jgi:hypothetical protein
MSTTANQLPLLRRFTEHQGSFANRASTLFPVFIRPHADTVVVFLDYWRIKNGIANVTCFVRVYDRDGGLVTRHSMVVTDDHNEISLARLLQRDSFEGLTEIEFVGDRNFVFAFPAVVAFYRSGDRYSAVHSSGRVRNPDEARRPSRSQETNWTCKFTPGVTPFFTLFNGPRAGSLGEVEVAVHDGSGRCVARKSSDFDLTAPFSSRIVKLDELFDVSGFDEDHFISVNLPDDDFFPRLVVGNFHRDIEFVEATHSFYWSALGDDTLQPDDADLLSFIPAPKVGDLDLEMVFFPTNAPAEVTATLRTSTAAGEALRETGESVRWTTGGSGAALWRYQVDPEIALLSFDFRNQPLPARLNTSYRYRVKGSNAPFCTDIATGSHAHVYPPKHTHWGHGLISDRYETVVMLRNIAHNRGESGRAEAAFFVYDGSGKQVSHAISVEQEATAFVYLRDLIGSSENVRTVSWYMRADTPNVEAFWISYSPDGGICGEHAF